MGATRGGAILFRRCRRIYNHHLSRCWFLDGVRSEATEGRLRLRLEVEEEALKGPALEHLRRGEHHGRGRRQYPPVLGRHLHRACLLPHCRSTTKANGVHRPESGPGVPADGLVHPYRLTQASLGQQGRGIAQMAGAAAAAAMVVRGKDEAESPLRKNRIDLDRDGAGVLAAGLAEAANARRWLKSMSVVGSLPLHVMPCRAAASVEAEAQVVVGVAQRMPTPARVSGQQGSPSSRLVAVGVNVL